MENHPDHPEWGTHKVVLTREIYIEQEDFMEVPVKKYFRMFPGNEVRLKGAYIVRCDGCEKDEDGHVTAVLCTVDMDTRNGTEGANRKVKGTLHWVSASENIPFEARLYEPLMMKETEEETAAEAAQSEAEAKAEADGEENVVSQRHSQDRFPQEAEPQQSGSVPRAIFPRRWVRPTWATPISSCGWATSARIRIPPLKCPCSTGWWG